MLNLFMKKCVLFNIFMLFAMNVAWAQGVDVPSANLPPEDGWYVSEESVSYTLPNPEPPPPTITITLDHLIHMPLTETTIRTAVGNDEIETFDSILYALETGLGYGAVTLTGPVQVRTTNRNLSTAGLFDTEIVSMSLSGNVGGTPVIIRESPTQASTGKTDIVDLGGGLYHIDSFFDVFTELSVDAGNTWIAADGSKRMTLFPIPEPATYLLMGSLLLVVMVAKRKKQLLQDI